MNTPRQVAAGQIDKRMERFDYVPYDRAIPKRIYLYATCAAALCAASIHIVAAVICARVSYRVQGAWVHTGISRDMYLRAQFCSSVELNRTRTEKKTKRWNDA